MATIVGIVVIPLALGIAAGILLGKISNAIGNEYDRQQIKGYRLDWYRVLGLAVAPVLSGATVIFIIWKAFH